MLELTVLVDNNVPPLAALSAEHGLSFYVKTEKLCFLWDTGATDLILRNAAALDVDLKQAKTVILSHHHYDHVGGLKSLPPLLYGKRKVIAQKAAFAPRCEDENELASLALQQQVDIVAVESGPLDLGPDLIFLAGIPRTTDFEGTTAWGHLLLPADREPSGRSGSFCRYEDFIPEDSALLVKSSEGLVIITGCSHSGIVNIARYAKKVAQESWGRSDVKCILGGLHLIQASPDNLAKTILGLKAEGVQSVGPCHCTDLAAKIALASAGFSIFEVGIGKQFAFT